MRLRQICCHPQLFLENYAGESSKLNQCLDIIEGAIAAKHKILLFSGFTSMFDILIPELEKRGIEFSMLTGQTKVDTRIEMVDEFNKDLPFYKKIDNIVIRDTEFEKTTTQKMFVI